MWYLVWIVWLGITFTFWFWSDGPDPCAQYNAIGATCVEKNQAIEYGMCSVIIGINPSTGEVEEGSIPCTEIFGE